MTYTTKHVVDCSNGEVQEVDLTSDEIAALQTQDALWQSQVIAQAYTAFVASAKAALDKSDVSVIRCYSAGVAVPSDIQAYRIALRAIVKGTDTTSTVLPTEPTDYPAGT